MLYRATTQEESENLVLHSLENPFNVAGTIKLATGVGCSVRTVQRRLNEAGLSGRIAAQKEVITEEMRLARRDWAREWLAKGDDFWLGAVFLDEKWWDISNESLKTVWRPKGTRLIISNEKYSCNIESTCCISLYLWRLF